MAQVTTGTGGRRLTLRQWWCHIVWGHYWDRPFRRTPEGNTYRCTECEAETFIPRWD